MFQQSLEYLIGHEGGYVNDPKDPGGETKWGISKRAHPLSDIAHLTREEAGQIYRAKYWDACRCGELPPAIAHAVFDCAVNQGPGRAIKFLQAALGVKVDGRIGPRTIDAARKRGNDPELVIWFQARRILHYSSLRHWLRFRKGWVLRAFRVFHEAMHLAQGGEHARA